MKCLSLVSILLATLNVSAQYFDSNQLENRACMFDNTIEIEQMVNWDVYQTIDGSMDGELDSSQCIEIVKDPILNYIYFDQFDTERPLYFKARIDNVEDYPINANSLYQLGISAYNPGIELNSSEDCLN